MPRSRAPAVVLAPPPPPAKAPPAVATLPKTEVQKVRFDFGYDDIEGGNLLGNLLGSLQEDRLSVQETVRALEADLRSQAPRAAASTNLKGDRNKLKECKRCNVLSLQLEALAQSMVGLAGAAFRWSLEAATGVSSEDREALWKALMSYMQPCAHVDARIASTSEELLKAIAKASTPDELLRSIMEPREQPEEEHAVPPSPRGDSQAPKAGVAKAKATPKSQGRNSSQPSQASSRQASPEQPADAEPVEKSPAKRRSDRSRQSSRSNKSSKASSRSSSRSSSDDYSSSGSSYSSSGSDESRPKPKAKASPKGG